MLVPFSLLPGYHETAARVDKMPADQLLKLGGAEINALFSAGAVSLTIYTTCVVLSIFKPWGRTRFGKRKLSAAARVPARD